MNNFKSAKAFGDDLRKQGQQLVQQAARQRQKEVARRLLQKILAGHPEDTGHSKSNWRASLGEPDYTVSDAILSEADQLAALEQVLDQLDKAPPNTTVYLSNGVHYVPILEHGHSDKAPEGFIALAIESVKDGGTP